MRVIIILLIAVTGAQATGLISEISKVIKPFLQLNRNNKAAMAAIRPNAAGNYSEKVTGTVHVLQVSHHRAQFRLSLKGLKPGSVHGFHVHQFGDLVTDGCGSAGSHYNPFHKQHGGPKDHNRHVGDLGNIEVDKNGEVDITFTDELAELRGHYSIYGRAFVVHEKIDDLGRGIGAAAAESKKTGNAGSRLGCGVIAHAPAVKVAEIIKKGEQVRKGRLLR